MADFPTSTIARFWSKVEVTAGDTACWNWRGTVTGNGYGNFSLRGQKQGAHRVAYYLHNGEYPPAGQLVRHKCDNPLCVNPHHLEAGTVKDNSADMVARGRYSKRSQVGAHNGASKLSECDVEKIRDRINRGETNTAIARDFPVSHAMVSAIRRGRAWVKRSAIGPQAANEAAAGSANPLRSNGRSGVIRTPDPLVPNGGFRSKSQ